MAETSVPREEVKVKRCPKCGETKSRPDFPKEKSHSDGLGSYCRVCTNAYAKRFREKYKIKHRGEVSRVGEKRCGGCKEVKPKTEFHTRRSATDGLAGWCKACARKHLLSIPVEEKRAYERKLFVKRRMAALTHYGGTPPKCAICNETIFEFLALDHINGGGQKHLKERHEAELAHWLIKKGFPLGFRVLCQNCNMATGFRKPTAFTNKHKTLRRWKRNLKYRVLSHYGANPPKCVCCGISNVDFLCIDHHGAERQKDHRSGGNLYHWIYKNGYPPGFRTLCHNCNSSIGFHGYCPHQTHDTSSASK